MLTFTRNFCQKEWQWKTDASKPVEFVIVMNSTPEFTRHPIYETVLSLIGFGLLYFWRRKFTIPGTIFFIYMIYNGIERYFIEKIRVNDKYEVLGLNWTQAQYLSVLFIILGVAGLFLHLPVQISKGRLIIYEPKKKSKVGGWSVADEVHLLELYTAWLHHWMGKLN
jgi:prolipoprotein diacylglyceryltransferase